MQWNDQQFWGRKKTWEDACQPVWVQEFMDKWRMKIKLFFRTLYYYLEYTQHIYCYQIYSWIQAYKLSESTAIVLGVICVLFFLLCLGVIIIFILIRMEQDISIMMMRVMNRWAHGIKYENKMYGTRILAEEGIFFKPPITSTLQREDYFNC